MTTLEAEQLGREFWQRFGGTINQCPFPLGSELALSWWHGYRSAKARRYRSAEPVDERGWKPYQENYK